MKLPVYLRVLLALTVLVCLWLFWQDSPSPSQTAPLPKPLSTDENAAQGSSQALATRQTTSPPNPVNLFPSQSWLPPPPPTPPPSVSPPTPPPQPFTVAAQWRFKGQSKIVVLQGKQARYTLCNACTVEGRIRPGTVFEKDYRLDTLTDTSVVLTYLPMRHVITLKLAGH